jgi:GGDEF domain-containing protein
MQTESHLASVQQDDALTGFRTRSSLVRDLEEAVAPGSPPRTLAIIDLSGYAATFGRTQGDELLRQVSVALSEALEGATFYRPRADELAVLLDGPETIAEQRLNVAVAGLNDRFSYLKIVIAFGASTVPDEANAARVALRIADARHYLRARRPRERRLVPRSR